MGRRFSTSSAGQCQWVALIHIHPCTICWWVYQRWYWNRNRNTERLKMFARAERMPNKKVWPGVYHRPAFRYLKRETERCRNRPQSTGTVTSDLKENAATAKNTSGSSSSVCLFWSVQLFCSPSVAYLLSCLSTFRLWFFIWQLAHGPRNS